MQAPRTAPLTRFSRWPWYWKLTGTSILLLLLIVVGMLLLESALRLYYRRPLVARFFRPMENSAGYGLQESQQYEYLHNGRRVMVSTDPKGRRLVPNAPSDAPV